MDNFELSSESSELKGIASFIKSTFRLSGALMVAFMWILVLASCNDSREINPSMLGYDYYPLEIGQYRIYEVEEIKYLITGFDTTIYQLREVVFDSIASRDQTTFLLRRDIRSDENFPWESDSVWTVARTGNYLAITENNIPYIKLTFPVRAGREWDGNSLNSRNALTYYYEEIDTPLIDSVAATDHIRLIIEDIAENVTGVDLRSEVYVRGIGLFEKNYLTQKKCTSSDCGSDLGNVIAGRSLKQKLIEVGNEQ